MLSGHPAPAANLEVASPPPSALTCCGLDFTHGPGRAPPGQHQAPGHLTPAKLAPISPTLPWHSQGALEEEGAQKHPAVTVGEGRPGQEGAAAFLLPSQQRVGLQSLSCGPVLPADLGGWGQAFLLGTALTHPAWPQPAWESILSSFFFVFLHCHSKKEKLLRDDLELFAESAFCPR